MIFLTILVLYLMRELSDLLIPLFFALFFAVLLQPVVNLFRKFLPVNVSIALTTLTAIGIFFFIGFGLFNAIQTLVKNGDTILESISTDLRPLINSYTSYFGVTFKKGELRDSIAQLLQSGSFWSASGSFVNSLSGIAAELLMTILYFAGLLGTITQYDNTVKYIVSGTPEQEEEALKTFNRIKDSVSSYIKVKTLVSLITGTGVGIVCLIFGIDYALLWGFLAFVLNYIPYIGSLIAIVPPLVLAIIAFNDIGKVLFFFVCLEGVQLVMGNVFEPRWMGSSFSINTVSVLFGFVFWAFMWDTAGMLLAVPLTFLFKVILEHVSAAQIVVRLMERKTMDE
ncbi:MAG: AI-2E family transporter [Ekhidna sp.]